MSGRIRTIKPELLEDAVTAGLSHLEFRLFIAMILMADDYGNLRSSPGLIRGSVFWKCSASEEEIESALAELEEVGLVTGYEMREQRYMHIRGWSKHQRVDKPGKPRVPSPSEPEVRPARPWVTYLIRLGDDGPIKIGRTFDVNARLPKLQTGAPKKLTVLRIIKGDFERALHERFEHLRQHGEWFEAHPDLLAVVTEESVSTAPRSIPEPVANDSRLTSDLRPTIPERGNAPAQGNDKPPTRTTLPADAPLTPALRAIADGFGMNTGGIDADFEWAKFVAHQRSEGKSSFDWAEAWRKWLLNAPSFSRRARSRTGSAEARKTEPERKAAPSPPSEPSVPPPPEALAALAKLGVAKGVEQLGAGDSADVRWTPKAVNQ